MGKEFTQEIGYLPSAIRWARAQNVDLLRRIVTAHSSRSLLTVGSGGSSTSAAFLAKLHESQFRKVSRWATPMGLLDQQSRPDDCAIALISAEGKNKDILAAAQHVLALEAPGFAFTLAPESPLSVEFRNFGATVVSFDPPWGKDGYLATNSLLASLILLARAYDVQDLDTHLAQFGDAWIAQRRTYMVEQGLAQAAAGGRQLCALYGRDGAIGAIDIESKMAESALAACQTADYRQFAHGRHLQLADPVTGPCMLAFFSQRDGPLARATLNTFAPDVPVIRLELPGDRAIAEIASVIDAMLITDILSRERGVDPGQPSVPQFGRTLHRLDLSEQVDRGQQTSPPSAIARKLAEGATSMVHYEAFRQAGLAFCERLGRARFRALVCDFDGTFCNTDLRFDGLDASLVAQIERIARAGVPIGFATGRGDSLHTDLREKLDKSIWSRVTLGFYSGSTIANLDEPAPDPARPDPRLVGLAQWLTASGMLVALGSTPKICGGQMSLRINDHSNKRRVVAYVRQWIEAHRHRDWRIFYSGHSVDIVTESAGKEQVVNTVAHASGCRSEDEILRLGDSGDIDGNDYELLNSGLGLSVAKVSMVQEACWNFLPIGLQGARGTLFYLEALQAEGGTLRFNSQFIEHARASLSVPETR
jgi:fructoselysine-6-P-deglycase FrlB-like protein